MTGIIVAYSIASSCALGWFCLQIHFHKVFLVAESRFLLLYFVECGLDLQMIPGFLMTGNLEGEFLIILALLEMRRGVVVIWASFPLLG